MGSNDTTKKEKVGVYICHCGGNISDHVDVEKVAEKIRQIPGVTKAHTNVFMCSDPGQELIQKDIKEGAVNRVVVASCAPSLHELTFRGAIKRADMNPYLYEHANIREQVSWVHHGEKATAKATDLVAAAVAKSKRLKPLEPIKVDAQRHATVIGGGVAGMRAALDLARKGITVALIEKTPFLGGQTAKLDALVPTGETAADIVRELAQAVMQNPQISVHTCTAITGFEGYVGNFKLNLLRAKPEAHDEEERHMLAKASECRAGEYVPSAGYFPGENPQNAEQKIFDTGAIVLATGFKPYAPSEGEYGYYKSPGVMTLPQFIQASTKIKNGEKQLTLNGKAIRRMAFIHCVGSRQIPGIHEPNADGNLNEYCSRTCCSATLQAAATIRERFPNTQVMDYYRDIRTYGRGQEDIYERASRQNVLFLRFEAENPPVVETLNQEDYPLRIRVKDTLTFGEELTADVDLIVLAVGMEPSRIENLVEMMKLPVGADGFLQEVHPKLRPVELANTGILLAGTCQAPMDVGEACSAAQAASAKAATMLAKGYVELDPFVAQVDKERCVGSGACRDVCPINGAITLHKKDTDDTGAAIAEVNPALCTGCGICVAVCPENAIDINGWSLQQYEAMVDAIVAA